MWNEQERCQWQISELMTKMEPCLVGYERRIIILAAARLIAAMLGPAKPETQDETIKALPVTVQAILTKIMELKAEQERTGMDFTNDPTIRFAAKDFK